MSNNNGYHKNNNFKKSKHNSFSNNKQNKELYNGMFINPYTFISIDDTNKDTRPYESSDEEAITGYLDCTLQTKTPLVIPDNKNEDNEYPFFRYDNNLSIPGSSIRGMIRSVYETITDSCLVTTNIEEPISLRTEIGKSFKAGLLMKNNEGEWELYKAKKITINEDDEQDYKNNKYGDKIEYKGEIYYLKTSEPFGKQKARIHLFKPEGKLDYSLEDIKSAIKRFEQTVDEYSDKAINKNLNSSKNSLPHSGYKEFIELKENLDVWPIWYFDLKENIIDQLARKDGKTKKYIYSLLRDGEIEKLHNSFKEKFNANNKLEDDFYDVFVNNNKSPLYLSLASIGRYSLENTLGNLVRNKKPCTDRNNLCKACALFGEASDKNAVKSKIRVSDAVFIEGNMKLHYETLSTLSSPRISYYPFYMKPPVDEYGELPYSYWSYDRNDAQINGRKYYWHHKYTAKNEEKNDMNSTVEILSEHNSFNFKIFYDGITKTQLEELMWMLTFGENKIDGVMCHKLGRGKPLGLGSIKIIINSINERNYDGEKYNIKTDDVFEIIDPFKENKIKKQLLKVININSLGKDENIVSYPKYYKDGSESFEWFTNNVKVSKNDCVKQIIKSPEEDDQKLSSQ